MSLKLQTAMRSGVKAQVPNLRGKKSHIFGCGCCWALNDKSEKLERMNRRELIAELAEKEIQDAN